MTHASLLNWQEHRAISQMEADRQALRERINRLPKHSHRRIELQARLRDLTQKALEAERRLT